MRGESFGEPNEPSPDLRVSENGKDDEGLGE